MDLRGKVQDLELSGEPTRAAQADLRALEANHPEIDFDALEAQLMRRRGASNTVELERQWMELQVSGDSEALKDFESKHPGLNTKHLQTLLRFS